VYRSIIIATIKSTEFEEYNPGSSLRGTHRIEWITQQRAYTYIHHQYEHCTTYAQRRKKIEYNDIQRNNTYIGYRIQKHQCDTVDNTTHRHGPYRQSKTSKIDSARHIKTATIPLTPYAHHHHHHAIRNTRAKQTQTKLYYIHIFMSLIYSAFLCSCLKHGFLIRSL